MPNSFEFSYQHNLDDVIDASDAVLAIGTEKVDTTTLKDRSLNNNDAPIHGAMRASGYFDGGRWYGGIRDYLEVPNIGISSGSFTIGGLIKPNRDEPDGYGTFMGYDSTHRLLVYVDTGMLFTQFGGLFFSIKGLTANQWAHIVYKYDSVLNKEYYYINGTYDNEHTPTLTPVWNSAFMIGQYDLANYKLHGSINYTNIHNFAKSVERIKQDFNTLARLPLYSHNFERYPNSDTSLTSVFPYTSGIITSGSFNKTDGLKCTSAGTIIFSNSFEFDGSEYITLVINGVEYSGTTTVTQGTTTATIAQGSNDITIDMGTNDVLEDIRIQFREEV